MAGHCRYYIKAIFSNILIPLFQYSTICVSEHGIHLDDVHLDIIKWKGHLTYNVILQLFW